MIDLGIKTADEVRAERRAAFERTLYAYAAAFEEACRATPHGAGTLLDAIDAELDGASPRERRRYDKITIFERWRPDVRRYLQDPPALALSDQAVDDLFRLAMRIENGEGMA